MLLDNALRSYERYAVRLPGGEMREYATAPMPNRPMSFVYCMATVLCDEPYLKIGTSRHPLARLQQISTGRGALMPPDWQGEPVDLLCTRPGGMAEERQIHRDLHEHRVAGTEWFVGHVAIANYIIEDPAWQAWIPAATTYH